MLWDFPRIFEDGKVGWNNFFCSKSLPHHLQDLWDAYVFCVVIYYLLCRDPNRTASLTVVTRDTYERVVYANENETLREEILSFIADDNGNSVVEEVGPCFNRMVQCRYEFCYVNVWCRYQNPFFVDNLYHTKLFCSYWEQLFAVLWQSFSQA